MHKKYGAWMIGIIMLAQLMVACGGTVATPAPGAAATPVSGGAATTPPAPAATPPAVATTAPVTGTNSTTAPSGSAWKGTLNWYQFGYTPGGGSAASKLADEAKAAFEKANPDIKINIVGVPFEGGQQKLDTALAAGGADAPDIFRIASDRLVKYVKEGLVSPIDPYLTDADKADIYPNVLAGVAVEGQHYAWPLWVPPVGVYLNTDIFKEKNVALPDDTWTYEQFVEIAKQLTFKRDDGTQVYGFSSAIQPDLINSWAFIYANGGRVLSPDGKTFTMSSPEAVAGLKNLTDLALVHKVTPPEFGNQKSADIVAAFKDQKALAMYTAPSADIATYRTEKLPFEIRFMPTAGAGQPVTVGGLGTFAVRKQDDTARLAAAMSFGKFLTSKEVADAVPGYYLAPPARASVVFAKDNPPMQKFAEMVAFTQLMPQTPVWGDVSAKVNAQVQAAVTGALPADEALKTAEQDITPLLK